MLRGILHTAFFLSIAVACVNKSYGFETKAQQAILMDYETGEILFEKNAHERVPPSSMSKLMTTYLIFEKLKKGELSLEDKFTISENAWSKQGSKMFIKLGSQVSVEDLLKGIIIQSGNDACIALAESVAGSEAEFANIMNKKALELGLKDSNFVNSTGWPDEGHLMSMHDLALLSKHLISDFPEYYHYFAERSFFFNNIKQDNRNTLLGRSIGVDGLKTGHTEIAGYGLASSAKQRNRRLIAVLNGLNSMSERAEETEKLLNYGFLNFANVKLFSDKDVVSTVPVWGGKKKEIEVYANQNIWFTLPKSEVDKVKILVKHGEKIPAPITENQKVAELEVQMPNNTIKKFDLFAKQKVRELSWFGRMYLNIKEKLGIS